MATRASSRVSTDHEEIRNWAEERGAEPACVRGTGDEGDIGMLRLEFPGAPGARDESLQPISWDDWFEKFDERGLALLFQEETARGQQSNFNKIIARETAEAREEGDSKASRHSRRGRSAGRRSTGSRASSTRSRSTAGRSRSASSSGAKSSRSSRRGSAKKSSGRKASSNTRGASSRKKATKAASSRGRNSTKSRTATASNRRSGGRTAKKQTRSTRARSTSRAERGSSRAKRPASARGREGRSNRRAA